MKAADCATPEPAPAAPTVQAALAAIEALVQSRPQVQNAQELQELERAIVAATDRLASAILAQQLQGVLDDPQVQQAARTLIKQAPKKLKNQGRRRVSIRPSRGPAFEVETSYYSPNQKGSRKKK
jgi:hypothetical protein